MIDSGDILSLLGIQREKVAFIDACHMNATEDNFKRSRNRISYINRNKKDI